MITTKDSDKTEGVSLKEIVEMCKSCLPLCTQRTSRVVENNSTPVKGIEKQYDDNAKKRQKQDIDLCMAECTLVQTACPDVKKLDQLDHYDERLATAKLPKHANDAKWREVLSEVPPVSDQDYTKCEHAAERFVQMLFAIAHKPTKVRFDIVDPKTGKNLGSDDVKQLTKDLKAGATPAMDPELKTAKGAPTAAVSGSDSAATSGTTPRW